MAQNNFIVDLIASLKKAQSKKQIKADIKTLGDIKIPLIGKLDKPKTIKQIKNDVKSLGDIFVPLIGKLNKSKTKAQLKQDTASLNSTVSLTGTVNQKSTNASVQQATKQAQAVANKNKIKLDASFNIKKSKLLADIQYFAQQNSKMMKDANMASKYNTLLDNAKLATSNKEIRSLRMQLSAMRSELRANNLAGLTLGDTLKKTFKRAMELFSGTGFVMLLSQQLRQAWRESLNLDQAFTNLVKVQSALTRGDYPEYLEQCTRKAKELATTQQALIEGATEFSKSGYDLTTSNKLSEKSTILSNVGEMSASDSAKAIISGVQAYDVVDGYTDVVDKADALISKYNEIGNSASITTAEIAQGVQAVGSVFKDANTSVDEFIALLAAGNRQFQDADSLALGLRTAALRIRGCTTELQLMNEETDGVYTSASKLAEKIEGLTNINGNGGVKILEADGETFRSIYDIFLDISKVYKDMSDVDASALLELISGKHRASAISAVLNNMAEAQKIYQRSLESAGSAQEEYDKYLESSIASLNNFKANMIETYQAVFNGETTKAILDTGSSVLELLNSLGLIESTLKGVIAIGAVKAFTTLSTAFKASALQASNFGKALQFANSIPNDPNSNLAKRFSSLKNIAIASKSLNEAQLKLVLSNKALSNEDRIRILRLMGLEKSIAKAKLEEWGLTQATNAQSRAQKEATINTFSFSAAVKGLGNSLRLAFISNPVGIAIMTLSTIIGAVSAKVSEYKENIRETRQANMDAATSAKEEADSLNELYIQYSKLSSITDKTSQQEDDFKQVVQDITKALGNKADALENVTIGTDEYAKSLREATKAELESQYATAKVGAKAAEEALKDKTYSGWDGSQITIAKNEQMTAIEEHVAALEAVQDILAKYEDMSSNGIEWEPIGWDEDRNDMNAVIEYYYDLIEARDRLATDDNADFLMSSDIYKSINTTINSLSESVKNYTEQQYQALLLQYEWQNGIPRTEEEFKAMEASILSASGAGEEFQKILKDFLINDFSSFFPEDTDTEIAKTEQSAKKLFDQLTASKESLDKFQSSVQSAYDSYAKLMNPDISSSDILSSIQSITNAVSNMDGSLNWEFIDGQSNSLELLGNAIEDISREYAESVLSGAGIDIDSKFGQMLANNIIQAQKASIELDNLNDGLDSLQSAYSSLTDIVEAYNETGYLTFDQLQTLLELEPQYLACLIDENGQLQLNEQAMVALANQRLNDAEAQAVQQAITELGTLALQDEQKAVEDNATAFTNAIDDLAGYNQELANTIAEATVGASAIRDLNAAISGAQSQGASDDQINTVLSNLETKLKLIGDVRNKVQSGGLGAVASPKSASKSGKKDADAYLEAFEKEYQQLKDKLDRGEITEKEYLDNLRALYERYFKDREKYIDEFEKYEHEYLEGMESLYKDVIDGICDLIDKQADKYDDLKDSAVDSYEAQKEAAEDAYDAQIDAIQAQIDAIDEEIEAKKKQADAIQDEIDKIRKAREERQKKIDLQKKEYELQRMQNQNTKLTYTSEKGFIFTPDTQGIRDAREAVDEAKEELYILQLEKQIDLINDEIDALEERKDALEKQKESIEKMKDASNEYYDSLIKKTEEFYDKLIDTLDKTKSRWQELADLKEEAEMKQKMEEVLSQYGITANDIVNMSEEAFNAFKNDYLNILSDLYSGNEQMQSAIAETAGTTTKKLGSYIASTQEYIDSLNGSAETLQPVVDAIDTTAQSMDNLDTSASNASESTAQVASDMETLGTNISNVTTLVGDEQTAFQNLKEEVRDVKDIINDKTTAIQDEQSAVETAISSEIDNFTQLRDTIVEVKDNVSDVNEELSNIPESSEKIEDFATAYDNLDNSVQGENGVALSDNLENVNSTLDDIPDSTKFDAVATSFGHLGEAIEGVADALGIGADGTVGGLVTALQEISTLSLDNLSAEGGTGIISQFEKLKTAVEGVTSAIGGGMGETGGTAQNVNGGSEGAQGSSGTLIGALGELKSTADETLGSGGDGENNGEGGENEGEGVIGKFAQFKSAVDAVTMAIGTGEEEDGYNENGAFTLIGALQAQYDKAAEVIPAEKSLFEELLGSIMACVDALVQMGTAIGSLPGIGGGNAYASGTRNAEKGLALVGEEKPEVIVTNDDKVLIAEKPSLVNMEGGETVYNGNETEKLLNSNGVKPLHKSQSINTANAGNAYAKGTDDGTVVMKDGTILRPLREGDEGYDLIKKAELYFEKFGNQMIPPVNAMNKNMEMMARNISNVNNNSNMANYSVGDVHIHCPGVTKDEVVKQIGDEMTKTFFGLSNKALQRANITR